MKRPNYEILIKAFSIGQQIKIGDYTYAMSDDKDIVVVDQNNPDRGFSIDLKFREFMKMADELSELQVTELAMDNAFNEIQRSKLRKKYPNDEEQ